MSEAIPLTITLASLPPDWVGNAHEYDATIPGRIVISAQQAISLFRSGTTEPASDEGLWFDTVSNQWKYYDYDTGNYQPVNVPQTNLRYSVSAVEPDSNEFLLWVVLDSNGQGEDIRTYYNGAWRSIMVGNANAMVVFGADGTGLSSMSYGTAGQVLVSAGAGLAPVWTTFDSTPVGTTIWRPYSSTPSGYIPAEGGTYSRASYPALHALAKADGYPHGDGDGITTFNVIDMRGRFPLGYGTGTATDATPHNLGDESGTETVALVEANNAPHTHTLEATVGTDVDDNALSGPPYYLVMRSESPEATVGAITGVTAASGGGAGTAHANMPPFAVGRWFIKAA